MARAKSKPRRKAVANRGSRNAPVKQAKSARQTKPAKAGGPNSSAALETTTSAALVLPETLDASSAGGIKDQLLTYRGSPLVIDAGQVRRTGMQAVQVLLAAARTWQADGQNYVVTNPTSEFLDTLALVGVSREHLLIEGFPG